VVVAPRALVVVHPVAVARRMAAGAEAEAEATNNPVCNRAL
jgi:hypothetical protein